MYYESNFEDCYLNFGKKNEKLSDFKLGFLSFNLWRDINSQTFLFLNIQIIY